MGLSAGQARLLTITARKSDCEYQSMRLSHQKIALSRELADLSNEYQNSLDQTKLIYDYYGIGDTSTPLSYNILMTPSILNDYMPITLTDSSGRVTLNSKYAQAARFAGIPQEGLGTLPSETMRQAFVEGLYNCGMISSTMRDTIQSLPYNQGAGFGGEATVAVQTEDVNLEDLIDALDGVTYSINSAELPTFGRTNAKGDGGCSYVDLAKFDGSSYTSSRNHKNNFNANFTLGDLLDSNSTEYYLDYDGIRGEQSPVYGVALMQQWLTQSGGFIDWIYEGFASLLDTGDSYTEQALDYAYNSVKDLLMDDTKTSDSGTKTYTEYWINKNDGKDTDERTQWKNVNGYLGEIGTKVEGDPENYSSKVAQSAKDYIGFVYKAGNKGSDDDGNDHSTGAINLNNIAKAFLTYFADFMNGVSATDEYGMDKYNVKVDHIEASSLITDDSSYLYTIYTGTTVSSDDCALATFYDSLFNQICASGWTENDNVNDNIYLQEMLQSGMLYISKVQDDGYYYQGNYATDPYIKEISDDTLIAQAEAKYSTEKAKLNSKEETLDMKMKNLDTEISSLTTEYDTVKNTISKNVEKSFKRYNA